MLKAKEILYKIYRLCVRTKKQFKRRSDCDDGVINHEERCPVCGLVADLIEHIDGPRFYAKKWFCPTCYTGFNTRKEIVCPPMSRKDQDVKTKEETESKEKSED